MPDDNVNYSCSNYNISLNSVFDQGRLLDIDWLLFDIDFKYIH